MCGTFLKCLTGMKRVNTWDKANFPRLSSGVIPKELCASLNARGELSPESSRSDRQTTLILHTVCTSQQFVVAGIVPPVYTGHEERWFQCKMKSTILVLCILKLEPNMRLHQLEVTKSRGYLQKLQYTKKKEVQNSFHVLPSVLCNSAGNHGLKTHKEILTPFL